MGKVDYGVESFCEVLDGVNEASSTNSDEGRCDNKGFSREHCTGKFDIGEGYDERRRRIPVLKGRLCGFIGVWVSKRRKRPANPHISLPEDFDMFDGGRTTRHRGAIEEFSSSALRSKTAQDLLDRRSVIGIFWPVRTRSDVHATLCFTLHTNLLLR